jgi:polysaccharide deacetylase family protein (PEP-CTERM system associated)
MTTSEGTSPQQRSDDEIIDGLSVDVEDYFHVEAFADRVKRLDWDSYPSRFAVNTRRILDIFAASGCRGTFFVLGWVAERDSALVREIAEAGHEIACHSHLHRKVTTLKPAEFREDLRRATHAIEDAAGVKVVGYRAPTFSIRGESLWALDILAEEGYLYDSSFFPIRHDLYGFPEGPRFMHRRKLNGGASIYEMPMSTLRLGGQNWPFGGGGYLRLLPMTYTKWAINRTHRVEKKPAIVYFHPWELDPEQPRMRAGWKSSFRHYTGLRTMERSLKALLAAGKFEPLINFVIREFRSTDQKNTLSAGEDVKGRLLL